MRSSASPTPTASRLFALAVDHRSDGIRPYQATPQAAQINAAVTPPKRLFGNERGVRVRRASNGVSVDDLGHRPPARLTMRERKIPLKAGLVELGVRTSLCSVALKPTGEVGCDDVAVFVGDEVSPWSQVDVG